MEYLMTFPEFIELNNQQLEKIKNRGLKNRIKNECNVLYKDYHNVLIDITGKDITGKDEIAIYADEFIYTCQTINNKEIIIAKRRGYKFILTNLYPFQPPKIFVNDQPYADLLRIQGDYQKNMLKKIRGQECLCCHSVNCSANWSPAIKIHRIINEINNTIKFKRDIINLLLTDKIKKKYNIPYAYIEAYLCLF